MDKGMIIIIIIDCLCVWPIGGVHNKERVILLIAAKLDRQDLLYRKIRVVRWLFVELTGTVSLSHALTVWTKGIGGLANLKRSWLRSTLSCSVLRRTLVRCNIGCLRNGCR